MHQLLTQFTVRWLSLMTGAAHATTALRAMTGRPFISSLTRSEVIKPPWRHAAQQRSMTCRTSDSTAGLTAGMVSLR